MGRHYEIINGTVVAVVSIHPIIEPLGLATVRSRDSRMVSSVAEWHRF